MAQQSAENGRWVEDMQALQGLSWLSVALAFAPAASFLLWHAGGKGGKGGGGAALNLAQGYSLLRLEYSQKLTHRVVNIVKHKSWCEQACSIGKRLQGAYT